MKEQLLKQIIEKQSELIKYQKSFINGVLKYKDYVFYDSENLYYNKILPLYNEVILLKSQLEEEEKKAKKKLSDPNLCCICHSNYVDSSSGFDTCDSCLKNI